jgi:protein TonB
MIAKMARYFVYPPIARATGISGIGEFHLVIDRSGRLLDVWVRRTSGSELLDRAGAQMIRDAAPYGPVPDDIPGARLEIAVRLPLGPD